MFGARFLSEESLNPEVHKQFIAEKLRSLESWRMPWQELDVTLGLKNVFSLRNLNLVSPERADDFLRNCGFDLARDDHARAFDQVYGEAVFFIRHTLFTEAERHSLKLPHELQNLLDPRLLFIFSSNRTPRKRYLRLWSCMVLKVMYAIMNLEFSGKLKDLEFARDQIFGRIKNLLTVTSDGLRTLQHKDQKVKLSRLEWKEAKTRNSILLKLLHKPDSIVDEVFDFMGVRFVVDTPTDIPRLLKILIASDILVPHQVLGMRTRNSILNAKKAQRLLEFSTELLSTNVISAKEFEEMCERIPWCYDNFDELPPKPTNFFSSNHYRALQITVRHLVRSPNPAFTVLESFLRELAHYRGVERDVHQISSVIPCEISRFFPVEIQVMDLSAYDSSQFGPASHEQYKASQLAAVRDRVLGGLLTFNENKMKSQDAPYGN